MVNMPEDAPRAYISFSAEINPNTTESLISVMANRANSRVQQVYLLLSTLGGQNVNGLNLYNVLKGMPFELVTHNVGSVDSIGNMIILAGDRRYATASATFMFHGVGFTLSQNQRLEQKDVYDKLDSILSDQKRIGNIISQDTDLTEDEIAGLFKEAQTEEAGFAIDKGRIHEIREVQISPGCLIISLLFQAANNLIHPFCVTSGDTYGR